LPTNCHDSDLDMMIGYREPPPPEAIEALDEAALASGGGSSEHGR
jgi:hypothetical protein